MRRRSPKGHMTSLDLIQGIATSDQGVTQTAIESVTGNGQPVQDPAASRQESAPEDVIKDLINIKTVPFQLEPADDWVRLLLVAGLLSLLIISVVGEFDAVDSLITLFSGVTGYYFGERKSR